TWPTNTCVGPSVGIRTHSRWPGDGVTRAHLVALPHTLLTEDYSWCAYSAKLRRFTGMLAKGGHTAIVYGPDVADIGATELVPIVGPADRQEWFGSPEWDRNQVFTQWNADAPC